MALVGTSLSRRTHDVVVGFERTSGTCVRRVVLVRAGKVVDAKPDRSKGIRVPQAQQVSQLVSHDVGRKCDPVFGSVGWLARASQERLCRSSSAKIQVAEV